MSNFLNALNNKNTSQIPVWFMRQAGRYLPEYMEVKNRSNFREMSHTPSMMKEITLQPLKRYSLDASIMFSDILTCLEYMGAPFQFTDKGPKLEDHGVHTLESLGTLTPEKDLSFVGEGIKLINEDLGDTPLIGFVGAPFTLASYLVEGGTSREFQSTRIALLENKEQFKNGLNHIANELVKYIKYQVECGVRAVQIFDSWGGVLSLGEYEECVLPSLKQLTDGVENCGVPVIFYAQPTLHLLPALTKLKIDAISCDWRSPLTTIAASLNSLGRDDLTIQGNVDPLSMTLDWSLAKQYVNQVLEEAKEANILNRYIFNVGHGLTPKSNTETVGKTIELVHSFKS